MAGADGADQLAAAAAFVQALQPATRARAFGVAQSGLYAVQGPAMSWTHLRGRLIQAQRGEAEPVGA